MNTLFVGGPSDGMQIVLQDGVLRHEVVVYPAVTLLEAMSPVPIQGTKHVYNKFPLHPVTRTVVFAHEDLTPTQIMEKLMDGYHPTRNK